MAEHRVLFDHDTELGRTTWLIFNEWGRIVGAHVEQEVDDIMEANAEAEKATHGNRFGDYNRVASIPLTFYEKTGIGDAINARDKRYISKVLNNADNRKFRTSRGNV